MLVKKVIDAVIVGPKVDVSAVKERIVIQEVLEASDIPYRHDRQLLHSALEKALQALVNTKPEEYSGFVILSRRGNKQLTQLMQLVTNLRRFFELQILRVLHHQPFQFMDLLL